MNIFDRLERRWGWLAFPGFLRFYALFHILVYVLQIIRPDLGQVLEFDRGKIFSGEVWRVATMFFATSHFGTLSPVSIIFLIFAVNFLFMVNDGLEGAWGVFKATLFYYAGILLIWIANFAYPFPIPSSGTVLYVSAFLAFATLFPKMEILLFFIIPVQIRFLGMLAAAGIVITVLESPGMFPFYVLGLTNYFVWAGIPTLRGTVRILESGQRKKRFNSGKIPASEAFHACVVCQKTDVSDPHLEFRIGTDGAEYCTEHLPDREIP